MLLQKRDGGELPLSELAIAKGEPAAALLDKATRKRGVEDRPFARDAARVEDVELGFGEWRGDLVLDDLHARAVADDLAGRALDRADALDLFCKFLQKACRF